MARPAFSATMSALLMGALFMTLFVALPLLQGCAAYSVPRDERTVGTMVDDSTIRTTVKADLMNKDASDGYSVKVYSYGGRVFLVGETPVSFRDDAVAIARKVKGVRSVTTHWFNPGTGDTVGDVSVATKVRTNLIAEKALSSTQIDLEVYGGQVVLLGMVRAQADVDRAIAVARSVGGVRSVKSYLIP